MSAKAEYRGPALFSYGFRPFFLAATLFGLCVVPIWYYVWQGSIGIGGPFAPTDWHIHEMVFGYGAAVIAGFLFTAVPNWTGRLPTRGWPLMGLLAIWIVGRLVVAGIGGLGPITVMLIDQAFLLAVAAMIAREIVAGKNWRNLKVLVPVTLLWLTNLLFHGEAMMHGSADIARRLGIGLLIVLIMMIGGRIVPSFTRNWMARRPGAKLPVPMNRFDGVALVVGVAALLGWVLVPYSMICALVALVAAGLHFARLWRWRGFDTWRSPLLLMLHLAYLMVPLGFLAVGAEALDAVPPAMAAHLLGIGAVGGMTMAVMMRATMGHTGRPLEADTPLTLAFVLLLVAAILRSTGDWLSLGALDGIGLAALCWTAAFALLAARIGPWLALPRAARKMPSVAAGQ